MKVLIFKKFCIPIHYSIIIVNSIYSNICYLLFWVCCGICWNCCCPPNCCCPANCCCGNCWIFCPGNCWNCCWLTNCCCWLTNCCWGNCWNCCWGNCWNCCWPKRTVVLITKSFIFHNLSLFYRYICLSWYNLKFETNTSINKTFKPVLI